MPIFAGFFVFFAMANCGLPITSGFVGEFFVILAAIKENILVGSLAALTLVLGAAYSLFLVKKVFYGEVANEKVANLFDVDIREKFLLFTFSFFILLFGIKPNLITDVTQASVDNLTNHVIRGKQP